MTTTKKNSKKRAPIHGPKPGRGPSAAKSTKGQVARSSSKRKRAARTDRADKAFKTLLRAKQKKQQGGQN